MSETPRRARIDPVWRKSPLVLLRHRGTLASVMLGATLLTIAAALFPLFLSRTASDLVNAGLDDPTLTRYGAGIEFRFLQLPLGERAPDAPVPRYDRITQLFAQIAREDPALGPAVAGAIGPEWAVTTDGNDFTSQNRIFWSTDAVKHVHRLRGGGSGVWISDLTANHLRVGPGDVLHVDADGRTADLRVAGVYHGLYAEPRHPYWHAWDREIFPQGCLAREGCTPPPQLLILSHDEFFDFAHRVGLQLADFRWVAPVAADRNITLDDAKRIEALQHQLERRLSTGRLGQVFECCVAPTFFAPYVTDVSTDIPEVITEVDRRVATIQGPGQLLQGAGVTVALLVIIFAGIAAGIARRGELELLFVEGAGPGSIAARTLVESALPCLAGTVIGLGAAYLLAQAMTSAGPMSSSAITTAVLRGGVAVAATLVLLSLVAAVSFARRSERHRERLALLTRLPWEVAVLAVAYVLFRRIQAHGAFTHDEILNVVRPTLEILVFPIIFVAGFAILAARLVALGLRLLRDRSGRFGSGVYLGLHRLAGAERLTVLMVAASALCLGIFIQGQSLVSSLRTTVDAKAKVFVGSDVSGRLDPNTPLPKHFAFPMTRVVKAPEAGQLEPSGEEFDLLGVDTSTLAGAAYWNPGFSSTSLADMLDALEHPEGDRLPAVLVASGQDVEALQLGTTNVPVHVAATTDAFPGMTSLRPTIVVSLATADDMIESTSNPLSSPTVTAELWVKGDTDAITHAFRSVRFPPYPVLTAREVKDVPYIAAVIDTFVVLNLLGIGAALLVIAGILVFQQARQRSQIVSYGLSLRMGMTHERHRRSVAFELAVVLLSALLVGAIVALVAALLFVRRVDPFPQIPPPPLFVRPFIAIALALVALAAVAWSGAWYSSRRAKATDFGEVMRLAE